MEGCDCAPRGTKRDYCPPNWCVVTTLFWVLSVTLIVVGFGVYIGRLNTRLAENEAKLNHVIERVTEIEVERHEFSQIEKLFQDDDEQPIMSRGKRHTEAEDSAEKKNKGRLERNGPKPHKRGKEFKQLRKLLKMYHNILQGLHDSVHLVPDRENISTDGDSTFTIGVRALMWTYAREQLSHNTVFGLRDNVEIVVPYDGYYFVYNQVTYAGSNLATDEERRMSPFCGHSLVRSDANNTSRAMLMYTALTQDHYGSVIAFDSVFDAVYPHDSSYQAGVFPLFEGELLYLQPNEESAHCKVLLRPENTFFGAFILNRNLP